MCIRDRGEITDYTGKLTLGHNVQIGYFAQNQASLLDEELTVFQTVDDVTPSELKSNTKNLLGAFMFSGDDIDKKVKVLSGGERTRLAMIKLLLQPCLLYTSAIFIFLITPYKIGYTGKFYNCHERLHYTG